MLSVIRREAGSKMKKGNFRKCFQKTRYNKGGDKGVERIGG